MKNLPWEKTAIKLQAEKKSEKILDAGVRITIFFIHLKVIFYSENHLWKEKYIFEEKKNKKTFENQRWEKSM